MLCTANRTEPRSERRAQETHTSLLVHVNDVYATRLCTYNVYATYTSLLSLFAGNLVTEQSGKHLRAGNAFVQHAAHLIRQRGRHIKLIAKSHHGTPSATPLLTLVASSTVNPLPRFAPNV